MGEKTHSGSTGGGDTGVKGLKGSIKQKSVSGLAVQTTSSSCIGFIDWPEGA